ncbi:membrane-bound PQQ-dependent dehydrogenase, glucose/quinate/shikimate family [Frateuria aurantia]
MLLLVGLFTAVLGVWLVRLGGSWYYLAAGIGVALSGVLLVARQRTALWLYAVVLLASTIWAIGEVKLDWWQLLPRLDIWFLLGLLLLLPGIHRALPGRGGRAPLLLSLVLTALVGVAAQFKDYHDIHAQIPASPTAAADIAARADHDGKDWTAFGRSSFGDRYAPATQITPANVAKLQPAWTFHTGDFKGPGDPVEIANEVTPLKVNGKLYICTPHNIVIALDPDTGKELWRHDPRINRDDKSYQHMICRGVSYWDSAAAPVASAAPAGAASSATSAASSDQGPIAVSECPRRIFATTMDATVIALDADTGKLCESFGDHGVIGLYHGMGMTKRGFLMPTSPPSVSRHVLVVAASVTDNDSTDEPSGVIRGYDTVSGKLLWAWDPARPDQSAPLPPGEHYVNNSPNSWGVSSIDEALGLVYLPMGNQTPDTWGGNRIPAAEKYNSAIVALDLATGKLRWVYQTVHHDIWDMDIGGQPSLVDIDHDGTKVPALIATTKRGDIYVLNRATGQLLVPAPEKPVPADHPAPGDQLSPTQPFSALSYLPAQPIKEADMWGTTPFDQLACRIIFRQHRYEGPFTPQTVDDGHGPIRGAIISPGPLGIFEWGGAAIDPARQILLLNPNFMGFLERLVPRALADAESGSGNEMGLQPQTGTPFAVEIKPFLSPLGFPCQAPPWGYVAAVDLRTMKKTWMLKNGTTRDSAPVPIALPLGVPSLGGMVTTGGGVAFLGATLDYYLRAYDVHDGRLLWQGRLPAGGQANPMSYVSDKTGRQYVVIMAGGHGSLGTKMGDSLVAFALPAAASPQAPAASP